MCVYVRGCVRACLRVPMFSNESCSVLGYDFGVSRTILSNMINPAHSNLGAMLTFPTRNVT